MGQERGGTTTQNQQNVAGKSYNLHGILFEKNGTNRIRIVPQGSNTVEFSLGEWNQVLMGLGFESYLDDPRSNVSGTS